jgi:hypothetical protein
MLLFLRLPRKMERVARCLGWLCLWGSLAHALYFSAQYLLLHITIQYERQRDCTYLRSTNAIFIEECLALREHHPLIHVLYSVPSLIEMLFIAVNLYTPPLCFWLFSRLSRLRQWCTFYILERRRRAENAELARQRAQNQAVDAKRARLIIGTLCARAKD